MLTLKTAAVKFRDRAGRYNRLQHFQARATPDGQGCSAEVGNRGVGAYLPGNYQVSLVPTLDNAEPEFAPAGAGPEIVTFNLLAGQGVALRRGRLREQTLAAGNRHRRGNGGVSLSNIGPLRSDLSEVGFLPRFQSFHGIHSPGSAVTAALVLSGAPAFHFVIPVQVDRVAECGVSLAAGGLPAHLLMTDCQFDGDGRLTDFRVNAGSYYGLHNLHGKSAIAATVVNSPVVVSGVQFDLEED